MKKIMLAVSMLFISTALLTAQSEWKLDKVHSSIVFTVKHMVISSVSGSFKDYDIVFK
jgi:polyisoprenoid-binding protein YceI